MTGGATLRSGGALETASAVNASAGAVTGISSAGTAALHGFASATGSPLGWIAQAVVIIAKSSIDYRSYKQGKLSYE